MTLNITVEDKSSVKPVSEIATSIHNILKGNQDYVDSNIVLNFENTDNREEINLFFSKDDCRDPEYIRTKLKEVADIIIDY